MLLAQSAYGRQSARVDLGPISLGRNLYPTLPEDRFDIRPFVRGEFALVADIRLDNRSDLANALGLPPERLARASDSELLFEALLKWNEKAADRLVGEFAFAFWNGSRRKLLLGRDLIGLRPLLFHRSEQFFAFSTMPSGLHSVDMIPHEFDAGFMAENLSLLPHAGTRTFYHGIERVEPATLAIVTRVGVAARRYWSPPLETRAGSPSDYEEGLRQVVEQAVSSCLRGAEEGVATHLSSGLDSSIVTTTAARLIAPKPVLAFTAVPRKNFVGPIPRHTIGDESQLAAETASLYSNIEHILVENSAESPVGILESNFVYFQQPSINLDHQVWARQINRPAVKRGLKVLLTGGMGNMTISYSGMEWLSWLVAHGRVLKALTLSRSFARSGIAWRSLANQLLGPLLPDRAWELVCGLYGRPTSLRDYSGINPALLHIVQLKAAERKFDLLYRPWSDPLAFRIAVLSRVDIGNYGKGTLAEYGLSIRDPTVDRRVLDYCFSVPPEEFVRGGIARSLARRAFADRLPGAVIRSPIRGYQSPDWYEAIQNDLRTLRDEAAAIGRCERAAEVVDVNWLQQTIETWPKRGWETEAVRLRYRFGLMRAIHAGHFMRKAEGTN